MLMLYISIFFFLLCCLTISVCCILLLFSSCSAPWPTSVVFKCAFINKFDLTYTVTYNTTCSIMRCIENWRWWGCCTLDAGWMKTEVMQHFECQLLSNIDNKFVSLTIFFEQTTTNLSTVYCSNFSACHWWCQIIFYLHPF